MQNGMVTLSQEWHEASLDIEFVTAPKTHVDQQGERFFSYGPLVYALPLESEQEIEREFLQGRFADRKYLMKEEFAPLTLGEEQQPILNEVNKVSLCGHKTPSLSVGGLNLRPMAETILRQVTFAGK